MNKFNCKSFLCSTLESYDSILKYFSQVPPNQQEAKQVSCSYTHKGEKRTMVKLPLFSPASVPYLFCFSEIRTLEG